jgi:hypothetical protein
LSLETAKYCLQAFFVEICYCAKHEKREADDAVPLILYRIFRATTHYPTLGQREVVTRAYQELIRVRRSRDGKSKISHCMYQIGSHRFQRGLSAAFLKPYEPWG